MKFRTMYGCLMLAGLAIAAERGQEIKLWEKGAPGSEGITAQEVSKPSTNPKYKGWPADYTVTHYPAIHVFLPPKEKATGVAMVVAPGGGHRQVVIEKEGWDIADWLNQHGIAAFVLKYRLAKAEGSKYTLPEHVYADAARSMRLVRSRAKEWGVDPERIGFIGFSAGGEIAGMIGTKFDAGKPDANGSGRTGQFTTGIQRADLSRGIVRAPTNQTIRLCFRYPPTRLRCSWCARTMTGRTWNPR